MRSDEELGTAAGQGGYTNIVEPEEVPTGARIQVPTDELPRRIPQDPEAVRNEQEVRRAAAELRPAFEKGPPAILNIETAKAELETLRAAIDELRGGVTIERTEIHPGDTIVIQCERRVSRAVYDSLVRRFNAQFPEQHVLVLEDGLKLNAVLGAEQAQEESPADGWLR